MTEIAPPDQNENILIVEDDRTSQHFVKKLIQSTGHTVYVALSAEEAIQQMTRNIAVVLLDLHLPGMDGYELLQRIRSEYPMAEVIVISSAKDSESVARVMKDGAFWFIEKPVQTAELLLNVARAIKSHSLSKQHSKLTGFLNLLFAHRW